MSFDSLKAAAGNALANAANNSTNTESGLFSLENLGISAGVVAGAVALLGTLSAAFYKCKQKMNIASQVSDVAGSLQDQVGNATGGIQSLGGNLVSGALSQVGLGGGGSDSQQHVPGEVHDD